MKARRVPDLAAAGALVIALLGIAILGVAISNFAGSAGNNYKTLAGNGFRPRPTELGKWCISPAMRNGLFRRRDVM